MKKLIRVVIGTVLFVAGHYHIHHHTQYIAAQSALSKQTTYVATPPPTDLKNWVAFRFVKPS